MRGRPWHPREISESIFSEILPRPVYDTFPTQLFRHDFFSATKVRDLWSRIGESNVKIISTQILTPFCQAGSVLSMRISL
jgi:hypothetical protein